MQPSYGSTKGRTRISLDTEINVKLLGSTVKYLYVSIELKHVKTRTVWVYPVVDTGRNTRLPDDVIRKFYKRFYENNN